MIRLLSVASITLLSLCTNAVADSSDHRGTPNTHIKILASDLDDVRDLGSTTSTAGDTTIFIAERRGVIKLLRNGALESAELLSINELVVQEKGISASGLDSIAIPSNNPSTFFISYTDKQGDSVLASVATPEVGDVAGPEHITVLMKIVQTAPVHPPIRIRFGADGFLYALIGSRGSTSIKTQQANDLRGAIIRLDVSNPKKYTIPSDNPASGVPPTPHERWARGIGESWAFFENKISKKLMVGLFQGPTSASLVELQRGADYTRCSDVGCNGTPLNNVTKITKNGDSLVGAFVYRGKQFPELYGSTIFAEQNSGRILSTPREGRNIASIPLASVSPAKISLLREAANGEALVVTDAGDLVTLVSP